MVSLQSTAMIVLCVLLQTAPGIGAFGISSLPDRKVGAFALPSINDRMSPQIPPTLQVATNNAAELVDVTSAADTIVVQDNTLEASQIRVDDEKGSASNGVSSANHLAFAFSNNLAWAAIATILFLSAALNTQVIGASLKALTALLTKCITGGISIDWQLCCSVA